MDRLKGYFLVKVVDLDEERYYVENRAIHSALADASASNGIEVPFENLPACPPIGSTIDAEDENGIVRLRDMEVTKIIFNNNQGTIIECEIQISHHDLARNLGECWLGAGRATIKRKFDYSKC